MIYIRIAKLRPRRAHARSTLYLGHPPLSPIPGARPLAPIFAAARPPAPPPLPSPTQATYTPRSLKMLICTLPIFLKAQLNSNYMVINYGGFKHETRARAPRTSSYDRGTHLLTYISLTAKFYCVGIVSNYLYHIYIWWSGYENIYICISYHILATKDL